MKKYFPKESYKNWLLFIVAIVIALIFYPQLPEQIPTHFDFEGNVNEYSGKISIFWPAGIIFFMNIVAEVSKRIDPRKDNYQKFNGAFYWIFFVASLLMILIQVLTILVVKGVSVEFSKVMMGAIALLFMVIGNLLPKLKFNFTTGIKTPWTIADERVWYLTHRLGGKTMMVGGTILLLSIFTPNTWHLTIFLLSMILSTLIPMIASYFYYQKYHAES